MENEIIKLLGMCKNGTLTVEATAELLEAMYNGDGEDESKTSESSELPWDDDGKLYIAAFKGHKYIDCEKEKQLLPTLLKVEYNGEALDVDCRCGNLTCGNIGGDAKSGGSISCGAVGGNVSAGGSVSVNEGVGQNVSCGGGAQISGDAGGNVGCGGGMTVGGSVKNGSVSAGGSMNIKGDVKGNVTANGNITCSCIYGKAESKHGKVIGSEYAEDKHGKVSDSGKTPEEDAFAGLNESLIAAGETTRAAVEQAMNAVKNIKININDTDKNRIIIGYGKVENKESPVTVNEDLTGAFTGELPDDGNIRIALFKGRKLISDALKDDGFTADLGDYEAVNVYCTGSLSCGDVGGDIKASGNVNCSGVNGNVTTVADINCDEISGNASADNNINCNEIGGDVEAGNNVECYDVEGSVTAGDCVSCGDVDGDVSAGGSVECDDVGGNVNVTSGDVTCGNVGGDIRIGDGKVFGK